MSRISRTAICVSRRLRTIGRIMDIKLLKYVTRIFAVLVLVAAVALPLFPDIKQREILAREQRKEEEAAFTAQWEAYQESIGMTGQTAAEDTQETIVSVAGTIHEEEPEGIGAQLQIELPEAFTADRIDVRTDCMRQKVYISFPCEIQDYFSMYHVRGSSDGIESLFYSYREGEGTLELETNQIYAVKQQLEGNFLYVDLENPHEAYDKLVVIDAGHGGDLPGAVQGNVMEKNIDLAIVKEIKKIFDNSDESIGVFYTRLDDSDPTLEQRVGLANALDADLFISIHNNSSGSPINPNINGTQVLYRNADTSKYSSKRFAQICLKQMVSALGSEDVGLLKGDDILIIKKSRMPVALIEVGFMTNPQELAKLNTQAYQAQAAQGVYNAVVQAVKDGF